MMPTDFETGDERDYRLALIGAMRFELVPVSTVDAAIAALPPSSAVSVTCSPVKGIEATIPLTDRLRSMGHRPVPHLAARMVRGPDHVRQIADWLRTTGVGHVFIVGGDASTPAGPYLDGLQFLAALLHADPGLSSVGVPSYPDGHPNIARDVLDDTLDRKQAILAEAGIAGYTTTQMCFDPATLYGWLEVQRERGLALPVHLGVAGVVDRARLITMGVRLGVGASIRYLRKNRAATTAMLSAGHFDPNRLLEPLSPALLPLGVEGIHCFTFNQVESTVGWQHQVLAGQ